MYCECLNVMCFGKALYDAGGTVFLVTANHILGSVYCLHASGTVGLKSSKPADSKCKKVCKLNSVRLLGFSEYIQCLPRRKCDYFVKSFFLFELVDCEKKFSFKTFFF